MNKSDQEISMRFRQLTAVGRMVLLLTMSIGALGYFNDTVRAQTPPAIKDVQPKVAQVGGSLKLVFSQPVKPTSVMIGAVNASIVAPSAVDKIELTVPVGVALGRQQITVTTEGGTQPITGAVAIAPVVLGLRAYQNAKLELSRVVMAGGEVIVQFSDKIPTDIRQSLEIRLIETKPTAPSGSPSTTPRPTTPSSSPEDNPCANDPALTFMAPEDDYLIVDIPKGCPTGVTYALGVLSGGTPLEKQTRIKIDSVWHMKPYEAMAASAILAIGVKVERFQNQKAAAIQSALIRLGRSLGALDGSIGQKTRDALTAVGIQQADEQAMLNQLEEQLKQQFPEEFE